MTIRNFLFFLLKTGITGLAIAFLYVLFIQPELLQDNSRIVELRQAEPVDPDETPAAATGVVLSYADAVEIAAPAIVNIHTAQLITRRAHPLLNDPIFQRFFGNRFGRPRQEIKTSLGSGVLISSQGYILTNNHVIEAADEIQVLLADGRKLRAEVVGADRETDLAVLIITADMLPSITIGDSENLRVGDIVLAIGNPFGVGQTVTQGIVSATGRDHLGINTYENFIQTDAAINPGNSGGALINVRGELIGINSAIFSKSGGSQGIGFAIPVNLAKGVLKQIIEQGHVVRGWLGIEAQDISAALAESFQLPSAEGVLISGVLRGGPADHAGILPGDVITAINDIPTPNSRIAMKMISKQTPNTEIELSGLREGKLFRTKLLVAQRPKAPMGTN